MASCYCILQSDFAFWTDKQGQNGLKMAGRKSVLRRKIKSLPLLIKIFLLWLAYVAVCVIIPPLFHKPRLENSVRYERQGTGQERVLGIDDNKEALLWRLRLIEEAKERIILCTFDFRDDNSGRDMMAALFRLRSVAWTSGSWWMESTARFSLRGAAISGNWPHMRMSG